MNVSGADRRGVGVVFGVVVSLAEVRALVRQLEARGVRGLGQYWSYYNKGGEAKQGIFAQMAESVARRVKGGG